MTVDERRQLIGERLRRALRRLAQPPRPIVGELDFARARRDAKRHAADVLDQTEPEHRGNRPQLTDGEERHALELAREQVDRRELEVSLGVRNQLDRQLVDARIAGERSGCQLRQLAIESARHARPDLANVLEDHIPVVEQPFAGGRDVHAAIAGERELATSLVEDAAGFGEPREERAGPKR